MAKAPPTPKPKIILLPFPFMHVILFKYINSFLEFTDDFYASVLILNEKTWLSQTRPMLYSQFCADATMSQD